VKSGAASVSTEPTDSLAMFWTIASAAPAVISSGAWSPWRAARAGVALAAALREVGIDLV